MNELRITPGQEFNALTDRLPDWSGWLSTFVVDSSGNYIGKDGTSKDLGNPLDLQMLIALRSKADAIVTTGATARAEHYKSSRFAPILFITRAPGSLEAIPAFTKPGVHPNLTISSVEDSKTFIEATKLLRSQGLDSFLFEGGATMLSKLVSQIGEIQLVLSIANLTNPESVNTKEILHELLPGPHQALLEDDFIAGSNRITRWVITA